MLFSRTFLSLLLLLTFAGLWSCRKNTDRPASIDFPALSEEARRLPENALAAMKTADGVKVELFAAEPLLTNPTNLAVDARGRIWVCEANNYRLPYNPSFKERPAGDRILILEDTDGDGRADDSKVFYQGPEINAALGITVLGNRVIVSHSPNIFIFTDEDGDDKPDRRDTLFTGIGGPDDDHGAHAVIFGPDGRYYFNFGNVGHQLLDKNGRQVVDELGRPVTNAGKPFREGMAFRFDPDSSYVEVLGYNFRNNYELTVDPFGTVWQSDNDDDGNRGCRINFVMEYGNYGYKDEITGAGWRERRPGMHEEIPLRHWHQNDPGVIPNLLQTGAGSPAGITFYTGDRLPSVFQNQVIHCEALTNVVRAYPVQTVGAGYRAEVVNLLESEDPWFRPVDVAAAPDGSLLVADWYDAGVGGNKMDDIQRGRIYRLAPQTGNYRWAPMDLSTPESAAVALLSPNMDVFYQAWTRLHEWGVESESALQRLWNGEDDYARAKALWLLARLPGKAGFYIAEALRDEDPRIRVTGLRVARQLDRSRLLDYATQLVRDPDPGVRRECAIALRHDGSAEASALWSELARQYDGRDRWYLEALGLGSDLHADTRFASWRELAGNRWRDKPGRDLIWRSRAAASIPLLAELIRDEEVDAGWLPRYFRAFHFKPEEGKDETLAALLDLNHPLQDRINAEALGQISAEYVKRRPVFRNKVRAILPSIYGSPQWLSAIESLELKEQAPRLMTFFLEGEAPDLQNEAARLLLDFGGQGRIAEHLAGLEEMDKKAFIARLGSIQHPAVVRLLRTQLDQPGLPFPLRVQLVESLGNSWDGQHVLYDMLKSGQLPGDLKNTAALKLMNCWNPEIRAAAPQYLSAAAAKSGVLPPVHELVDRTGNIAQGKKVFDQYCRTCHQIDGQGVDFGPDLSYIGEKLAKEALFTSILYPSAGINFGYEGYLVKLQDGTLLNGILTSDTEEQLSVKLMDGTTRTVDKTRVQAMEAMEQSLMTANLQAVMSERALVNLVEYLSSLKETKEL